MNNYNIKEIDVVGKSQIILCAIILVFQATQLPCLSEESNPGATYGQRIASSEHVGFFQRHPKLRKFGKVAAIGAVTGGLGGALFGGSIATHAVVGAGVHTGMEAAKEKQQDKKHHVTHE